MYYLARAYHLVRSLQIVLRSDIRNFHLRVPELQTSCSELTLTRWGRVTHICVGNIGHYWSAPSHYLNQCWNIVNWTLGNKLQWNFNRNSNIFIQENAFERVVCEMAAILSRPQWVKIGHRIVHPLMIATRGHASLTIHVYWWRGGDICLSRSDSGGHTSDLGLTMVAIRYHQYIMKYNFMSKVKLLSSI